MKISFAGIGRTDPVTPGIMGTMPGMRLDALLSEQPGHVLMVDRSWSPVAELPKMSAQDLQTLEQARLKQARKRQQREVQRHNQGVRS